MMAAITSAMIRRPTERSRSAEDAVTSRRTLRSGAPAAVISRSHDAPHCPQLLLVEGGLTFESLTVGVRHGCGLTADRTERATLLAGETRLRRQPAPFVKSVVPHRRGRLALRSAAQGDHGEEGSGQD
jgi:hypothetical protein